MCKGTGVEVGEGRLDVIRLESRNHGRLLTREQRCRTTEFEPVFMYVSFSSVLSGSSIDSTHPAHRGPSAERAAQSQDSLAPKMVRESR